MRIGRFVTCSLLFTALQGIPAASAADLRLGVLPRLSAAELTTMFRPLADHIAARTGKTVELVIPKDFAAFEALVKSGEIDLGFANPYVYVKAKRDTELVPLALAHEKKGGAEFRGILIVRKDSGITELAALKGKPVIFVEQDSLGGYLSQALLFEKAGIDPLKDVVRLPFARKHDNVAMAVYSRAAAAGGIREDDLEKMQGKVDLSALTVLARTEPFPNWPLFASARVDPVLRDAIRVALLELSEGAPALTAAKLKRFGAVTDKDYDVVRAAARTVGAF